MIQRSTYAKFNGFEESLEYNDSFVRNKLTKKSSSSTISMFENKHLFKSVCGKRISLVLFYSIHILSP